MQKGYTGRKTLTELVVSAFVTRNYRATTREIQAFVWENRRELASLSEDYKHTIAGVLSKLKKRGFLVLTGPGEYQMVRRYWTMPETRQ